MEGLLSLLLFAFFFIVLLTRIIRFIIRVFKGIEERTEDNSSLEKSSGNSSSTKSKQKSETSRSGSGSRKGPPPGFELDLSEIDDKFADKKEKREKPEVLDSDTVKEYKARQEEKDKKDKAKTARPRPESKSMIESGEIGGTSEIADNLSFDNKSLVTGIMMKEILSPPRSLKPYKPVYKDKE